MLHLWAFVASRVGFTVYVTYLLNSNEHSPSWEANRFSTSQENSPHFMEPEGLLPQSQVLATCPYSEHLLAYNTQIYYRIHGLFKERKFEVTKANRNVECR